MPLRLESLAVDWLDAEGNKSLDRTSQEEGLPPLLGEFAERGQAPLPDLFDLSYARVAERAVRELSSSSSLS